MTPRLLSANLCVHVTDRDHVEMDNDNEIIIDEEIREELQSIVESEELCLFCPDICKRYIHALKIEEVNGA